MMGGGTKGPIPGTIDGSVYSPKSYKSQKGYSGDVNYFCNYAQMMRLMRRGMAANKRRQKRKTRKKREITEDEQ